MHNMNNRDRNSIWLCLYFPNLPVEIFCRDQDNPRPVVILERHRIIAMNREARQLGIEYGSGMNTAYALGGQVQCFERNEAKEQAALAYLAQWAYQFTPAVSIRSPHALLLDVTGCLTLFKGLARLKARITKGLMKLGFQADTGVNGTPMAALCAARAGLPDHECLDNNGDSQRHQSIRASLAPAPLDALDIRGDADRKIIESFRQMGISTVGQLLELPLDGLNRRFGVFFTDYLLRLTGERPDPRRFIDSRPDFFSELTFLSDVTQVESLVFPLKRLLGELQAFLRGRQLLVSRFRVRLSHRHHRHREFTVYLANPENDAQLFLALAQLRLEQVNDMPEVDAISLAARHFVETGTEPGSASGDLFHGTGFQQQHGQTHSPVQNRAEAAKATRLLNMLTARLGRNACFTLSPADDHRPEKAWQPVRLEDRKARSGSGHETNPRPVYLLPVPKPLISHDNRYQGRHIRLPGLSGQLELLQGPERIEFGWWDEGGVRRDYYIARHASGALYWIFRNLDDRQWFLHGIFS